MGEKFRFCSLSLRERGCWFYSFSLREKARMTISWTESVDRVGNKRSRGSKSGLWFFPFVLNRYRELDLNPFSDGWPRYFLLNGQEKVPKEKAAPRWRKHVVMIRFQDGSPQKGYPYPSADWLRTLEPLRVSFSTSSLRSGRPCGH